MELLGLAGPRLSTHHNWSSQSLSNQLLASYSPNAVGSHATKVSLGFILQNQGRAKWNWAWRALGFQHTATGAVKVSRTSCLLPTALMRLGRTQPKFHWVSYCRTKAEPHLTGFRSIKLRTRSRTRRGIAALGSPGGGLGLTYGGG